ncbi:MAG: hypothetical protein KDJ17_06650 [Hyphomicrobiaceae bacterium]|nr:hypothetical protein [Hyphomicrobiaceae bacterium]
MKIKFYQVAELIGVFFLLASTAAQMFYVEPLKREIEWRLSAFNMQQNGQVQLQAVFANRIAVLKALKAEQTEIDAAQADRAKAMEKYQTADANIANYLLDKENIESILQIVVLVLFGVGSLLAGFGRAMELIASRRME